MERLSDGTIILVAMSEHAGKFRSHSLGKNGPESLVARLCASHLVTHERYWKGKNGT